VKALIQATTHQPDGRATGRPDDLQDALAANDLGTIPSTVDHVMEVLVRHGSARLDEATSLGGDHSAIEAQFPDIRCTGAQGGRPPARASASMYIRSWH